MGVKTNPWSKPRLSSARGMSLIFVALLAAVLLSWSRACESAPRPRCPLPDRPPFWDQVAVPALRQGDARAMWRQLRAGSDSARWRETLLGLALILEHHPDETAAVLRSSATVLAEAGHLEAARRTFDLARAVIDAQDVKALADTLLWSSVLAELSAKPEDARLGYQLLRGHPGVDTPTAQMLSRMLERFPRSGADSLGADLRPPVALARLQPVSVPPPPLTPVTLEDVPFRFGIDRGFAPVEASRRPGKLRFTHAAMVGLALEVETTPDDLEKTRLRSPSLAMVQAEDFHRKLSRRMRAEDRFDEASFGELPGVGWAYQARYQVIDPGEQRWVIHLALFPRFHRPFVARFSGNTLALDLMRRGADDLLRSTEHLAHPWPETMFQP